jgi:hypothetical protein
LNVTFKKNSEGQRTVVGLLTGYAYETVPNKAITTGQAKGTDEDKIAAQAIATPTREPITLGLLARGSPGLSLWRREETAGGSN